ncbi:MAG: phosphoribosylanthranilate isomerase [Oceanicaulis sp.]|uniref:phosphoribosylanthranilate isomerase n=1 Tax=Glycocaulis sp. TaxID=1969725 RepID=UPI0025B912E3|nr:phosphoribosylanthranilate isomerase [Glycocaulis sp.]MCC5980202.1 phosphoribosylanthranilate isomerase [Oceanicaulis sp.]MCH8522819.1 phosphoribosylanthranilate isomerase [Glycocaulis sp.]
MATRVKICGMSDETSVRAAVAAGADYLGFIIFEKSPRAVSVERAAELAALKGPAKSVAVLVDPDDALLGEVLRGFRPDIIQLHGGESPERCLDARNYAAEAVWKAVPVASSEDVARARRYAGFADAILFDAKPPRGADRPGGWGEGYDYGLVKGFDALPFILAGGLNPDTVADAIAASGARVVDTVSGVESAPGVKDIAKIGAFVKAAKG